jgi:hypothetical protein
VRFGGQVYGAVPLAVGVRVGVAVFVAGIAAVDD